MFKQPKIIIRHELMGPVEALMTFSAWQKTDDGEFHPRHIALIKTKVKPKFDKLGHFQEFTYRFGSNISWNAHTKGYRYYILWGTSNNHERSGWTELTTPTGRPVRGGRPFKMFKEACDATATVRFTKTAFELR
jgi:hypothetical protein